MKHSLSRLALLALGLLLGPCCNLAAQGSAQSIAWITTGGPSRQITGRRAIGVGDMNLDGYEDMMCLAYPHCVGGDNSLLMLFSGQDGSLLREIWNPCLGTCGFSSFAATGDWDGDGVPDYAEINGGAPGIQVHSGVDDAILQVIPNANPVLGGQMISDLDLDGDGLKDIVVGTWTQHGYLGRVRAYSHSGAVLYELFGDVSPTANPPLAIAYYFAALGDVDDDGCDDFAMGCGEPQGRGAVAIVSGRTGSYLRVCYGELPGDGIGGNVEPCGDLDGDGYIDVAAGQQLNATLRGAVRVFSSRTGAVLHQWVMTPGDGFSDFMSGRGVDLDGDGVGDLVVARPDHGTGSGAVGEIYVYSGRTGGLIHLLITLPAHLTNGAYIGVWPVALHPPAGEHIGTFVCSTHNVPSGPGVGCGNHRYGTLTAYHGLPRFATEVGPACAGQLATPPNIGMTSLGASGVRLHLSQAPPDSLGVLLLGLSNQSFGGVPLPAPLDLLGLPGCFLRTSVELMHTAVTATQGIDSGYASIDVPLPVSVSGSYLWLVSAQWWALGDAASFPGGMSQVITWRR